MSGATVVLEVFATVGRYGQRQLDPADRCQCGRHLAVGDLVKVFVSDWQLSEPLVVQCPACRRPQAFSEIP